MFCWGKIYGSKIIGGGGGGGAPRATSAFYSVKLCTSRLLRLLLLRIMWGREFFWGRDDYKNFVNKKRCKNFKQLLFFGGGGDIKYFCPLTFMISHSRIYAALILVIHVIFLL